MPYPTINPDGSGFTVGTFNDTISALENTAYTNVDPVIISGLEIVPTSGLEIEMQAGAFQIRSYMNADAYLYNVPNNQVSYLWLDDDTLDITPTTTTTPPSATTVCLGKVTASAGAVTAVDMTYETGNRQELKYSLFELGVMRSGITLDGAAALKARVPTNGEIVRTTGYWTPNDGGGALFYYDDTDLSATNEGTVFRPDSVAYDSDPGRWLMIVEEGRVNVKQFGAILDGTKRNLTTTYSGVQRFANLAAAQTLYGSTKGTWFELMDANDTLDAVAIQAAIDWALENGCECVQPHGQARVNRSVWIGKGEHGTAADSSEKNLSQYGGFHYSGVGVKPRDDGDGSQGSGIYMDSDIGNRYTLRCNTDDGTPSSGGIQIVCLFGSVQTTATINYNDDASDIETKLETLTDLGANVTVTCPLGGASATLASGHTFVIVIDRDIDLAGNKRTWHGELTIAANTLNNDAFCRVYSDSGVVCLRGSAQYNHRVSGLVCRASIVVDGGDDCYGASHGVLHTHSTWQGFSIEDVTVQDAKYIFGIADNETVSDSEFSTNGVRGINVWSNYTGDLDSLAYFDMAALSAFGGPDEPGDGATSGVESWSRSVDSLRATKRAQLPVLSSAYTGTLNDKTKGEVWYDDTAKCWMGWDGSTYYVVSEIGNWSADKGDANFTWALGNEQYILYATVLTAIRTVTLGTTNVPRGKRVSVYRTGGGLFTLQCSGASIAQNAIGNFVFDGSAWKCEGKSTIL